MLINYKIENFKSFGTAQSLRLAPITLICGPNSSGKSSIIQSLLLLKQTSESDSLVGSLSSQGGLINLGDYESFIFKHDIQRELKLEISYTKKQILSEMKILGSQHDRIVSFGYANAILNEKKSVTFLKEYSFLAEHKNENHLDFRLKNIHTQDSAKRLTSEESLSKYIFLNDESRDLFISFLTRRIKNRSSLNTKANDKILNMFLNKEIENINSNDFIISRNNFLPSKLTADAGLNTGAIANSLAEDVKEKLKSILYLGPLRCYPSRFYTATENKEKSVGKDGQDTVKMIHDAGHLTVDEINNWFELFEVPYKIKIGDIGNKTTGKVLYMQLQDLRTNVIVAASDVGFGIGQLLPIIVEGLVGSDKTICVEQPEIHLHPKLQGHLGDYFIKSFTEKNNQWIIETHSEALILRLQRRIKEGKLSHKDICVVYVDPTSQGAEVSELRLDADGDFIDEWPNGFFEDRFNDVFGL
ncbi:AAA family ATPase [Rahnella sp. GSA61A]|uniref:AAA family ATPase n=1 Tax=Rahnella sp. GSA61A TaxID=2862678 RepID=UPI001CC18B2F|nr:AAA family ATPase [Rahnella sp. GSA61A]